LLLKLDAEMAHNIGKWGMEKGFFSPGPYRTDESETRLFGFKLDNPLILAPGFDKNGELADRARDYGFALVEEGNLTYEGGAGNEKPRLFRIRSADGRISLLNRMGLNGDPAEKVVERLSLARNLFAVNIAKTHNPGIVGDRAIEDFTRTYELVARNLVPLGKVVYVALNLSCPNTEEGKTFEEPEALAELVSAVGEIEVPRPGVKRVVKLSLGLCRERVEGIVGFVDPHVDGYIGSNTLSYKHEEYGRGGLSGPGVQVGALETIRNLRSLTDKIIIGCGGLGGGGDFLAFERAGANVFQALNGFVVGSKAGPYFAHDVLNEYYGLRKEIFKPIKKG
jgi:dihydroorotate dehydrogenase